MKRIEILVLFLLILNVTKGQNYIGINDYSSLRLNNNEYTYQYWDISVDSGSYSIKGDTLLLNSYHCPIKIININTYPTNTLYGHFAQCQIYRNSCLVSTITAKYDSTRKEFYIKTNQFKTGNIIGFLFIGMYRKFFWNDSIKSGNVILDERYGRRTYFNNYKLLINCNFILPFNEEQNDKFFKINGYDFLPMVILKNNKNDVKYHLSGYGAIH